MVRSNQTAKSSATRVQPQRAFEDVIVQIRQAIVERRLAVGDRLPHERDLAERFGVSRQSVREGLRMLEAFGVLSARRGAGPESGWTVSADGTTGLSVLLDLYASLQRIPIWDLLEIREALEMLSVRSAAAHATAEDAAQLLDAARAMADVTTPEAFLVVDAEFHVAIARRSGNSLAPLFMEAIREAMSRVMLAAFEALPDWASERELLVREHIDVANKIGRREGDAAAAAVSAHIRGFYGRALKEISSVAESAMPSGQAGAEVTFLRRAPLANGSPPRS